MYLTCSCVWTSEVPWLKWLSLLARPVLELQSFCMRRRYHRICVDDVPVRLNDGMTVFNIGFDVCLLHVNRVVSNEVLQPWVSPVRRKECGGGG